MPGLESPREAPPKTLSQRIAHQMSFRPGGQTVGGHPSDKAFPSRSNGKMGELEALQNLLRGNQFFLQAIYQTK